MNAIYTQNNNMIKKYLFTLCLSCSFYFIHNAINTQTKAASGRGRDNKKYTFYDMTIFSSPLNESLTIKIKCIQKQHFNYFIFISYTCVELPQVFIFYYFM